jgi:hypothetical protein
MLESSSRKIDGSHHLELDANCIFSLEKNGGFSFRIVDEPLRWKLAELEGAQEMISGSKERVMNDQ